jgi:hypothetical protein
MDRAMALQSNFWGRGPKVGLQTFNLLVWVRFPAPPLEPAHPRGGCLARAIAFGHTPYTSETV